MGSDSRKGPSKRPPFCRYGSRVGVHCGFTQPLHAGVATPRSRPHGPTVSKRLQHTRRGCSAHGRRQHRAAGGRIRHPDMTSRNADGRLGAKDWRALTGPSLSSSAGSQARASAEEYKMRLRMTLNGATALIQNVCDIEKCVDFNAVCRFVKN